MPRRKKVVRRPDVPDAKFKSKNVARFINKMMYDGKRSLAERILYNALDALNSSRSVQLLRYSSRH